MYLANPCSPAVIASMRAGSIGYIDTPAQGNKRPAAVAWCADNGCFGKGYPGDEEWFAWLERNKGDAPTCLFAVAPDVVGDAAATLERSTPWFAPIRALGYPVALVAQDGLESLAIPWDDFDVLFIGGTTAWKLGAYARVVIHEAKRRGKWIHMGRVNSEKRYRYAHALGCDSADGTFLVFGPDKNLPRLKTWLRSADQGLLDFGEAG